MPGKKNDTSVNNPSAGPDIEGFPRALILANEKLAFQIEEKEKRAAELVIANQELAFQNEEKEKRAAELIVANHGLAFQNEEKENRAAELILANHELAFQNQEKEKRAAELILANYELAFQNEEKEKRAAELILANHELAFQNEEKEKSASELVLALNELALQNKNIEKQANELLIANRELESFTFISSHDLQEPLRKIQTISDRILSDEYEQLTANGKNHFERIRRSAQHMQTLINDLLAYSRTDLVKGNFKRFALVDMVDEVLETMDDEISERNAVIDVTSDCDLQIIPFQFRQLIQNLLSNSLKFYSLYRNPYIVISGEYIKYDPLKSQDFILKRDHSHITITDNGIGFDPKHNERIFEIFQRLNGKDSYHGNGMGLTIARKIVENHKGIINASGDPDKGVLINLYLPFDHFSEKQV